MPFSYIQISELPTFKKIFSRKWPYSTGSRRKSSSIRGKLAKKVYLGKYDRKMSSDINEFQSKAQS